MFKSPTQEQLLSSYFRNGKKIVKNGKVNLFGKAIATVNKITCQEQILQSIAEIDLSHNSINRIEDVKQLKNVEIMNLCHNKISSEEEVLKLSQMHKLHTLIIKKNPFLKTKMTKELVRFLTSLELDAVIGNGQIQKTIGEIVSHRVQIITYSNYLDKLNLNVQLINKHQMQGQYANPEISMFPKVKKMLEQSYEKHIKIRRQFVNSIKMQCFDNDDKMMSYLNDQLQNNKHNRSYIIKRVYETEEIIKNQRTKRPTTAHSKRVVQKDNSQIESSKSHNIEYALSAHKRSVNQKIDIVVSNLKRSRYYNENSPPKGNLQMSDIKDLDQFESQFMHILAKINPLFHLLHSPLISLKDHQKELLLQNLLNILRQKMKENYKLNKLHKEDCTIKTDFKALQEHLQALTSEVIQQQQVYTQTITKYKKQQLDNTEKMEDLEQKLAQKKEQLLSERQQTIQLVKRVNIQLESLRNLEVEEDAEQKIGLRRQERIKTKYLRLLQYKAQKMNKLKKLRRINQIVEENESKYQIFQELKLRTFLSKRQKKLRFYLLSERRRQLVLILSAIRNQSKQYNELNESLRKRYQKSFVEKLILRMSHHRYVFQHVAIAQKKKSKMLKRHCFDALKAMQQEKAHSQIDSLLNQYRNELLSRKMFRTWKRYLVYQQKQAQNIEKLVNTKHKKQALQIFIQQSSSELSFNVHVSALDSFLYNFRKFRGYLKFTKITGQTLLCREIRAIKVKKIRLYYYFEKFVTDMKDKLVQKRIKADNQKRKEQQEIKQAEKLLETLGEDKKKRLNAFQLMLVKFASKIKISIAIREKKSVDFQKERTEKNMRMFYRNIKDHLMYQIKMNCKKALLRKSSRFVGICRIFFKKLVHNRDIIANYQQQKAKKIRLTCLYRWKAFIFWQRMQNYRMKFEHLCPEINKMTDMQIQLSEERQVLQSELERKQLIIQQYIKKCEQYEYSLQSKDIKYEKLKNIYSHSAQQQQLNYTIKMGVQSKFDKYLPVRNESVYLKYLPSELQSHRKDTVTELIDNQIRKTVRNRLNTTVQQAYDQNRAIDYPYDYKQPRRSGQTGKHSFLSTFRKF